MPLMSKETRLLLKNISRLASFEVKDKNNKHLTSVHTFEGFKVIKTK